MGCFKIFEDLLRKINQLVYPHDCTCGSDDISVEQSSCLNIFTHTIIRCRSCGKEIKRRTYKKAVSAWNNQRRKGDL